MPPKIMKEDFERAWTRFLFRLIACCLTRSEWQDHGVKQCKSTPHESFLNAFLRFKLHRTNADHAPNGTPVQHAFFTKKYKYAACGKQQDYPIITISKPANRIAENDPSLWPDEPLVNRSICTTIG